MKLDELRPLLSPASFKPMKIVTARNGTFDVAEAGHLLLTSTQLYVGRDVDDGVPRHVSTIPLLQIVRVEPA
jgi:hypothetical protein